MSNGDMSVASPGEAPATYRTVRRYIWLAYGLALIFLTIFAWGSDFFSPKGERTLYTARCVNGRWSEGRCNGRLETAERIRYKVQ